MRIHLDPEKSASDEALIEASPRRINIKALFTSAEEKGRSRAIDASQSRVRLAAPGGQCGGNRSVGRRSAGVPQRNFAELSTEEVSYNLLILLAIPEGLEHKKQNQRVSKKVGQFPLMVTHSFLRECPTRIAHFFGRGGRYIGTSETAVTTSKLTPNVAKCRRPHEIFWFSLVRRSSESTVLLVSRTKYSFSSRSVTKAQSGLY